MKRRFPPEIEASAAAAASELQKAASAERDSQGAAPAIIISPATQAKYREFDAESARDADANATA